MYFALVLRGVDGSDLDAATHDLEQPLPSVDVEALQWQVHRSVPIVEYNRLNRGS